MSINLDMVKPWRFQNMLTFKQEYLCDAAQKIFEQLTQDLPIYIRHYNERRPHMSCNYGYPSEVHELAYEPKKLWKQRPRSYPKKPREDDSSKPTVAGKIKKC